jgi:hypothetical protein
MNYVFAILTTANAGQGTSGSNVVSVQQRLKYYLFLHRLDDYYWNRQGSDKLPTLVQFIYKINLFEHVILIIINVPLSLTWEFFMH